MQVRCDCTDSEKPSELHPVFDKCLMPFGNNGLQTDGTVLFDNSTTIGLVLTISDGDSQNKVRENIGIVEWILLEFEDWTMIPIENMIAECEGTITKIAARITSKSEIPGAAFALEKGVDAILIGNKQDLIEQAMIAKSQRLESENISHNDMDGESGVISLEPSKILEVSDGGIGDRYCIDLTSVIENGEGMLIGSSASSMILVHGEVVESEFVPPRPFRVNAGPPHSYVMMANEKTKYISELKSGDEILLVNQNGNKRIANIGRLKVEKRPFLRAYWQNNYGRPCSIFLQQAETVRVVCPDGKVKSITKIKAGDEVMCYHLQESRHIGNIISAKVKEV